MAFRWVLVSLLVLCEIYHLSHLISPHSSISWWLLLVSRNLTSDLGNSMHSWSLCSSGYHGDGESQPLPQHDARLFLFCVYSEDCKVTWGTGVGTQSLSMRCSLRLCRWEGVSHLPPVVKAKMRLHGLEASASDSASAALTSASR